MAGSHARRDNGPGHHGHGHGHGGGHGAGDAEVAVGSLPRGLLLGSLVLALLATIAGLVWLWPDGDKVDAVAGEVQFAVPGVTLEPATVERVQPACAPDAPADDCGQLRISTTGDDAATVLVGVPPGVLDSGVEPGDEVRVVRTPPASGATEASYSYFGTARTTPVALMALAFVVVVLAVARWRGLMALVGLAFAAAVMTMFVIPALLGGESGVLVGVVGSAAIMFVVLYTTHGWSLRTSAALAGTLGGVVLTAALGTVVVSASRLTGVSDESSQLLSSIGSGLSFTGLLACAVVVAGLGVLNDVTITQSSSAWEIRAAAPEMSRRAVFAATMRIGRDHIASTIYTIVFAYAGASLTVLLVLRLYGLPFLDLLATEEIGQEVVRTLATSIGLVLAVPLTTLIAVATLPPGRPAHD